MLFASFCPWVRVPIWQQPYSNSSRRLAPDGALLAISVLCRSLPPFGLRSAPFLFNQFSDALERILQIKWRPTGRAPYFGRFFIAEPTRLQCLTSFSTLLRFFMSLQAPVVASKPLGPPQELEFMGVVLDSIQLVFGRINLTAPWKC